MAGNTQPQEKLNHTLKYITALLKRHKIANWFIGYGTLLGVVRSGSCIDHDDDVDIVCDKNDFDTIHTILLENHLAVTYGHTIGDSRNIIKTVDTPTLSSIDFYCATVDDDGNFADEWEGVVWSNCFIPNTRTLWQLHWRDTTLQLPHNHTQKLANRYGQNWMVPQHTKGPLPRLKRL